MAPLRSVLVGEHPRLAAAVVLTVALVAAVVLAPLGLFSQLQPDRAGETVFPIVFGVVPLVTGAICGVRRLGFPAALGCGVAPGVSFVGVVAVGAALGVGSFGGGDSPLLAIGALLTASGVGASTVGFVLGAVLGVVRE